MHLTVTIPEGVREGERLAITHHGGADLEVQVPAGYRAGDELCVSVGSPDEEVDETMSVPRAVGMELVEVSVPEGVVSGESFPVVAPWGETFLVTLPEGESAGSTIMVELPLPSLAEDSQESHHRDDNDGCMVGSPPKRTRQARVSREHRTSREIAREHEHLGSTTGGFLEEVGGGHHSLEEASRPWREHGEGEGGEGGDLCFEDSWTQCASPSRAGTPASAGLHRYVPGTRVHVLRSNGTYSVARVLASFEGVFDTLYQVELESGQVKQAVPEEEMYAEDAADPAFGQHLIEAMLAAMEAESEFTEDRVLLSESE